MIDLTPIFNVAIAAAIVSITAYLIPFIRSKLTSLQFSDLTKWTMIAVSAAEQLYKGSGRGEEKKQAVVEFLNKKGFKIDFSSLDTVIEAAVLELNKSNEKEV